MSALPPIAMLDKMSEDDDLPESLRLTIAGVLPLLEPPSSDEDASE